MPEYIKIKSLKPSEYRLLKKKNGEIVLQGAFPYKGIDEQGKNVVGVIWGDIPIKYLNNTNLYKTI